MYRIYYIFIKHIIQHFICCIWFIVFGINWVSKGSIFSKIWLSAAIAGITVLIMHFTVDSCLPDSCPKNKKCKSVNGFYFECISFACEGNACCENGPNPLCCLNDGVCSNENFVFNGTNSDECQCICDNNFAGKHLYLIYNLKMDFH